ncbi:sugar ABC transporter substrate-binding protein, partial [Streptomyces sp. NPDC058534]
MKRSTIRCAGIAGAVALTLAVGGCSDSDPGSGSDSASSSGKASITFWGWAPGYEDAVKAFN